MRKLCNRLREAVNGDLLKHTGCRLGPYCLQVIDCYCLLDCTALRAQSAAGGASDPPYICLAAENEKPQFKNTKSAESRSSSRPEMSVEDGA